MFFSPCYRFYFKKTDAFDWNFLLPADFDDREFSVYDHFMDLLIGDFELRGRCLHYHFVHPHGVSFLSSVTLSQVELLSLHSLRSAPKKFDNI